MRVSIITVTFNSADFVEDCLQSVLSQTYPNIEHIVVDGGSRDGTLSILESHAAHLAQLISEPDEGIYDAMNKGIKHARGDVIGFLNSDDLYESNDVIAQVADLFLKYPTCDACYADLVYTKRFDTSHVVRYWRSSEFSLGSFARGWCPAHPTFFVRRSVYEQYGAFDRQHQIAADVELMMRFLEIHKVPTIYVPKVWVRMRLGGTTNNGIKNIFSQNKEVYRALTTHGICEHWLFFIVRKICSRAKQYWLGIFSE